MAIQNDLPWDPSLVDPTDRPADGLIARFVGGRSGPIAFENGATVSFPWKRQQETAGTFPGTVQVHDNPTTEFMELTGPTLTAGSDRASVYLAGWDDGTASIGLSNGDVNLFLTGSQVVADDLGVLGNATVNGTVQGATVHATTALSSNGGAVIAGLIEGNGGIDTAGGTVSLASTGDATITALDDVIIAAADDVGIAAGGATGTVALVAAGTGNVTLDSPSGGYVHLNLGNQRSVTANSYPVVPLRDRDGTMVGTAPAVTASETGFKWQAGRKFVAFTAGSGTLNFLSGFDTGVVTVVCTGEGQDVVMSINTAVLTTLGVGVYCYVAGAAYTGDAFVNYVALGW